MNDYLEKIINFICHPLTIVILVPLFFMLVRVPLKPFCLCRTCPLEKKIAELKKEIAKDEEISTCK
jgi:hypothetical protein